MTVQKEIRIEGILTDEVHPYTLTQITQFP